MLCAQKNNNLLKLKRNSIDIFDPISFIKIQIPVSQFESIFSPII